MWFVTLNPLLFCLAENTPFCKMTFLKKLELAPFIAVGCACIVYMHCGHRNNVPSFPSKQNWHLKFPRGLYEERVTLIKAQDCFWDLTACHLSKLFKVVTDFLSAQL